MMIAHTSSAKMQEFCSSVLWGGSDDYVEDRMATISLKDRIFGVFDSCDVLIRALLLYPNLRSTASDATNALGSLSRMPRVAHKIIQKGGLEVMVDLMKEKLEKVLESGDEQERDYLKEDLIPAIRVVLFHARDYDPKDDEDFDEDDFSDSSSIVPTPEWDKAFEEIQELYHDSAIRLMSMDNLDSATKEVRKTVVLIQAEFVHSLCTMIKSSNTGNTLLTIVGALNLYENSYKFVEKHDFEDLPMMAFEVGAFFSDLVGSDGYPADIIYDYPDLAMSLCRNILSNAYDMKARTKEITASRAADSSSATPAEECWRLTEFVGFVVDRAIEQTPIHEFWSKETVDAYIDAFSNSLIACIEHWYTHGVAFTLPAFWRLATTFDGKYGDIWKQLRANKELVAAFDSFVEQQNVSHPFFERYLNIVLIALGCAKRMKTDF